MRLIIIISTLLFFYQYIYAVEATILKSKVICKQEDRYLGWPTIVKTNNGELIVVFSGNRDAHVCPWGVTQMIRSKDNGLTWGEAVTINNTPLDDRDAGIIETKAGTLIVNWFTSLAFDKPYFYEKYPGWKRHAEKLSDEIRNKWLGNWIRTSKDGGLTWDVPVKQSVSSPHGPIELREGRLLYVGIAYQNGKKLLGVEESLDDGQSWQLISSIPIAAEDSMQYYWEPHVVEYERGRLIAMFRYQPKDRSQCFLRQSESYDGGTTWRITHKTPIWGYPPHIMRLENDWLLVVYGVRREPYGEHACISTDGGKTWAVEDEIILNSAMNGDLGYPASVQLEDNSILTVYYQIDKEGEKTCLMSTHWRLY
jgi:hypothetical protein